MTRLLLGLCLLAGCTSIPPSLSDSGMLESLAVSGTIGVEVRDADGNLRYSQTFHNNIPNTAETALRDCFGGTGTPTCTVIQAMKYHGLGTSSTAVAETDTGCVTELTTQYQTDGTRATGTQTNGGADVYRTVATNTVDATVTIYEFCLMGQATTGGPVWTRAVIGPVTLNPAETITTTYNLTIN